MSGWCILDLLYLSTRLPPKWRFVTFSNLSRASSRISSSQPRIVPNLSRRCFRKIRLRNELPHTPPLPAVASRTFSIGFNSTISYVIRSCLWLASAGLTMTLSAYRQFPLQHRRQRRIPEAQAREGPSYQAHGLLQPLAPKLSSHCPPCLHPLRIF